MDSKPLTIIDDPAADPTPVRGVLAQIESKAVEISKRMGVDWRTGVRRAVGTAEWQHDDERVRAAAAKRMRKRLKNRPHFQPLAHVACGTCWGEGSDRGAACKNCGGTGMIYV